MEGAFHYERTYDIDNDAKSKEPHFILDGKVEDAGKVIKGTWQDQNDGQEIGVENHPSGFATVDEMRKGLTKLEGNEGEFVFNNDRAC